MPPPAASSHPLSPSVLVVLVRLLALHAPHLQSSFSSSWFPPFIAQALTSIASLSEVQLKSLTKAQIDVIYSSLLAIATASALPQLVLSLHSSRLALVQQLLCSDQFQHRIVAMSLLNDCLEALTRRDDAAVPPAMLHAFIVQADLITYLLSPPKSHPELVKRALQLLTFGHAQRLLTAGHFEQLASWLHSGYDHALHIVYGLLLELTSVLPIATCVTLYKTMMDTLRPQALTTGMLRFFYHFSMRVLAKRAAALEERKGKGVGERREDDPLSELRVADGEWIGLTTWWELFRHSYSDEAHPLPPAITHTAIVLLQSMLRSPLCEPQRDFYAHLCIDNVVQGRAASTSLQVLTSIIQSFPPVVGRKAEPQWHGSQAEYVVWLETRWHLLDLVIHGMASEALKDGRRLNGLRALDLHLPSVSPSAGARLLTPQSPSSYNSMSSPSASSSSPFFPTSSHSVSDLQTHFHFLETFLRLSTLTLSLAQARRLWSDHYLHAHSSPASQAAAVRFFHALLSHRAKAKQGISVVIDDAVCLFFLQDCLCRLQLEAFTSPTFACFELYFLAVNSQQTLLSSPTPASMVVNSYALHGLDELWSLVMIARDEAVRADAARLLLRVYHARSNIAAIGAEGCIKRCVAYMNSPIQPSSSFSAAQVHSPTTPHTPSASPLPFPDDDEPPLTPLSAASHEAHEDAAQSSPQNGVDWEDESVRKERTARCLRLLHAFIKGPKPLSSSAASSYSPPCSSSSSSASASRAEEKEGDVQVILQLKPPGTMKHVLTLPAYTTVASLRQQASPLFSHPPSYIDLTGTATSSYNNKLIPDTVSLLSIPSNPQVRSVTVTVSRRPAPEEIRPTSHVSSDSPASLLAQSLKHYEKLYELMSPRHPVALARPAFELLQLLPANASLFAAVLGQQLKWKRLLPAQAPLQLLHTLGVVSDIITKQPFEGDLVGVKRDSWLSNFIETDGLLHLRDVMMRGIVLDSSASAGSGPSALWMRGMRVKAFGVLMTMMITIARTSGKAREVVCEKAKHAVVASRVLEVLSDATIGMSGAGFDPASNADARFIADCCVPTINACFSYLELLLSTPNRADENVAVWTQLYSAHFSSLFLHTLLESPLAPVRRAISTNVKALTEQHAAAPLPGQPNPLMFFTNLLLSSLSQLSSSTPSSLQTGEFLSLLSALFRSPQLRGSTLLQQGRGEAVVHTLTSLIAQHASLETSKAVSDDSLRGLLAFAAVLFHFDPALKDVAGARLVRLLYADCLFAVDEQRATLLAKAKHHETRGQAYQTLLAAVLRCQGNTEELLRLTMAAHNAGRRRTKRVWEIESEGLKSSYVGLQNLGNTSTTTHTRRHSSSSLVAPSSSPSLCCRFCPLCVISCYFAAVIQQLVMVPGLSEALLSIAAVKDEKAVDGGSGSGGLAGDQLYDFQSLVLPLVLSNAASIDPSSFIAHFSFFGEPVNPLVQMDCQEFLSVFFDRLSTSLSRTSSPRLLHSFFGGTLSNRITSLTCPHSHAREEAFFMLSLNIQHHRDIRTSLAEFFKGEVLAGPNAWMCGECKGKVDAERRSVVTQLPELLILHLKRFEFDFDLMRKKKLNDECHFPLVLSIDAFVHHRDDDDDAIVQSSPTGSDNVDGGQREDNGVEGVGDVVRGESNGVEIGKTGEADGTGEAGESGGDGVYDLVGVVIHSGHAEGGHYWSLVKDRFSPSSSSSTTAQLTPWLQFNDQKVSPFFIDDLAAEAFGGMEEITVDVSAKKEKTGPQMEQIQTEKQRSAYLLLYAKRNPAPAPNAHVQAEAKEGIKGLRRPSSPYHEFPANLPVSALPPYLHELYGSIASANLALLRDQLALDPPYAVFMLRCFLHAYDAMRRADTYPLAGKLTSTYSLSMIQSLSVFTLNVMTRARHSKRLEQFIALLQHMLAIHVPGCYWLLERCVADEHQLLRQSILESSHSSRRLVTLLLDLAVAKLVGYELDAEYVDKIMMIAIADRDKEKQAAEGADADLSSSPPTSTPASTTPTPPTSAPSSATSSPVMTPSNGAPPIPPRVLAGTVAVSPSPLPPPLPARALPTVDATLAPDNMFKVKSVVSLASPLTVLHGIGAPSAKALTGAGIATILQLAQVKERSKKDYNALLSSSKLSPKQLVDAVDKARAAVQFIRQIGGDEQPLPPPKAPSPAPVVDVSEAKVNGLEASGNGVGGGKRVREFVGLNEYSVLPRFMSACLWLLQSVVSAGNEGSAASMELVDLCTKFARRSALCARLLIERGALDTLIGLYLGQHSGDAGGRELSQVDSLNSASNDSRAGSRSNSFSLYNAAGGVTLDSLMSVPPLPPLPELTAASSSSPPALLPPPQQMSPAVSAVPATLPSRPPDKPHQLDYDQSPILVLIVLLVKYCRLPHWPEQNVPPTFVPSPGPPLFLAPHTRSLLASSEFLARLAHHPTLKSNVTHVDLACHLCWLDLPTSLLLLHHILACVQHCDAAQAWPALCQMQGLLTLGDDEAILTQRIHLALPTFLSLLPANCAYYKLTDLCLRFLLTLQQAQPLLAAYLHGRVEELSWVPAWLASTKKPPTRSQPVFCDDGRVISLYRSMDHKPSDKDSVDAWTYPMGDLGKVYKALVEEAKKKREAGIGRGDIVREPSVTSR